MKRRKFLLLSLFGLFISLVAIWYYKYKSATDRDLRHPLDLTEICNRKTLINIGNTYRKLTDENNKKYLEELLYENAVMRDNVIKDLLKTKVAEDFDNGNTILIDGWLLSITEARQCALLSIAEEK
ncbi:hypothetical protein [uncultured Eudoraea sp.]|uniref:hypothetical protein n=1 Tax=uncultured Eudoraea sp. TaxID=1035614 RepID=UPI00263087F5|nr:hypothetical protein [uncultured Eudoraea sp.]